MPTTADPAAPLLDLLEHFEIVGLGEPDASGWRHHVPAEDAVVDGRWVVPAEVDGAVGVLVVGLSRAHSHGLQGVADPWLVVESDRRWLVWKLANPLPREEAAEVCQMLVGRLGALADPRLPFAPIPLPGLVDPATELVATVAVMEPSPVELPGVVGLENAVRLEASSA